MLSSLSPQQQGKKKKKKLSLLLDDIKFAPSCADRHLMFPGATATIPESPTVGKNSFPSPARKRGISARSMEHGSMDGAEAGGSGRVDGAFTVGLTRVRVRFGTTFLSWSPTNSCVSLLCCIPVGPYSPGRTQCNQFGTSGYVEAKDIVTCTLSNRSVTVHFINRQESRRCKWRLRNIAFRAGSEDEAAELHSAIQRNIRSDPDRPRNLLVIVNPYGGAREAMQLWTKKVEPVFSLAGVKAVVQVTERQNHAREIVEGLSLDQLRDIDGLVAVGGDGLFQETLNGLIKLRSLGPQHEALTRRLRLGHIPAGSTDALAYSLHGTRSPLTAALHIVVGDRLPLDVMRVDAQHAQSSYAPPDPNTVRTNAPPAPSSSFSGTSSSSSPLPGTDLHHIDSRYSVCMCSCGYFGEVMRLSEKMRWLGPRRYDLAGAMAFAMGRQFRMRVQYSSLVGSASGLAAMAQLQPQPLPGKAHSARPWQSAGGTPPLTVSGTPRVTGTEAAAAGRGVILEPTEESVAGAREGSSRAGGAGPQVADRTKSASSGADFASAAALQAAAVAAAAAAARGRGAQGQAAGPSASGGGGCCLASIGEVRHHTPALHTTSPPGPRQFPAESICYAGCLRCAAARHQRAMSQKGGPEGAGEGKSGSSLGADLGQGVLAQSGMTLSQALSSAGSGAGAGAAAGQGPGPSVPAQSQSQSSGSGGQSYASYEREGSERTRTGQGAVSRGQSQRGGPAPASAGVEEPLMRGSGRAVSDSAAPSHPAPPSGAYHQGGTGENGAGAGMTTGGQPPLHPSAPAVHEVPAYKAFSPGGRARKAEVIGNRAGTFKAIMACACPCRSSRSPHGLAPGCHLSDGQLQLIMVSNCSRAQYLGFLLEIAKRGITKATAERLPFVEVVEATGFCIEAEPGAPLAVWNVDGELVQCSRLSGQVHGGLVDVFSRGVEW